MPGVREVMGSNPIGTQIFSRPYARVTLHYFHIYLPSCNFTMHHSFIIRKTHLTCDVSSFLEDQGNCLDEVLIAILFSY